MGGRGAGKTRTGAEWVRDQVKQGFKNIGLIGPTADDVRSIMIEGVSGLMSVVWGGDTDKIGRPIGRPLYEPSRRKVTWPNGAMARLYSAEEPERLRGPQHQRIWADEIGAWKYAMDTWDMAMFGLRVPGPNGEEPQILATTTPRPTPLMKMLVREPTTVRTEGSSERNKANLAPSFFSSITRKYQGTRLGRQELGGELLEDIPGAIFTRQMFDKNRVRLEDCPRMQRIVVAIDPSGAGSDTDLGHNEIGICSVGRGVDGKAYVFEDATMLGSPRQWARMAIGVARHNGREADRIVAETNFGGAMVESTLRMIDPNISFKPVVASRGKVVRAEPVSALAEQNKVKMVGAFPYLEDELCSFTENGYIGETSPNRADAFVWAVTDLFFGPNYALTDEALGTVAKGRNRQ